LTLGACSGGDFGRTREDMRSADMHRWVGLEATSSVALRPSQFQLTTTNASRSRFSPDRAAAFAPRLEGRVRRLSADGFALAPGAAIRPHRLRADADRRAAPLALESLDVGSDTLTGVNDADYQPPFAFTGKLSKVTLTIDRPKLSPEDIKKLEKAKQAAAAARE
jgi:hypothetical protein